MTYESYNKQTGSEIIASIGARPEMLVQILVAFVERFGWITEDAVRQLAVELNLSRAEVHGVVSYYHDFRTSAPGQHVVRLVRPSKKPAVCTLLLRLAQRATCY